MIRPRGNVAASSTVLIVMGLILGFAPASAMAEDAQEMRPLELTPPPQIAQDLEDDVREGALIAGSPAASGGAGGRTFLALSGGVKAGPTGVAGYGFDNNSVITDHQGNPVMFQNAEYYGHGGVGGAAGLYAEARLSEFIGLELGINRTRNTAWGHEDKNHAGTGVTLTRIESRQVTWSTHVPILVKGVIPSDTARPFLAGGIEIVSQTDSMLEYDEDPQAAPASPDYIDLLNERNQIETTTYPLLVAALGVEVLAGPFVIPFEVRLGYALGHDRNDPDSRAWYDSSADEIHYDGVFMSHFAVFTGLMYEFDFIP